MNWKEVKNMVPQAGQVPDFDAFLDVFPALRFAAETPQSPVFHAEGDVWTHTKMVIGSLLDMREYQQMERARQEIVFLAALLHDVAKHSTTVIDPATGAIGQPGHSKKGAIDARIALWDAGMPFDAREAVCRLIANHQVPFFAIEGARNGRSAEFIVRKLSCELDIELLAMLAEADIRGRICPDVQKVLDNIELFRELSREEDCYGRARDFVDAHTRVSYFRGADVHPDYALFQEDGSKVTVMCGLPASGKNTWVDANRSGLPVISFDDARDELGLRHGQNDGQAAHFAVDKAKGLLRKKLPFVWNATHLSQSMRNKSLDLLYSYGAEVEIVYIESPRVELLRRNAKRDTSLTNKALQAMLLKWELPVPTEVHRTTYLALI